MKLNMLHKYSSQILAAMLFTIFIGLTGCSKDNNENKTPDTQSQQASNKPVDKDSTIIRAATVNVESLDADKDGNLYQCEMDYNVISDNPGTCPKCGMKLVKVSVAEAKKNFNASNGNE